MTFSVNQQVKTLIDSCVNSLEACKNGAIEVKKIPGREACVQNYETCIQASVDCIEAFKNQYCNLEDFIEDCILACKACVKECEKHEYKHCKDIVKACLVCIQLSLTVMESLLISPKDVQVVVRPLFTIRSL